MKQQRNNQLNVQKVMAEIKREVDQKVKKLPKIYTQIAPVDIEVSAVSPQRFSLRSILGKIKKIFQTVHLYESIRPFEERLKSFLPARFRLQPLGVIEISELLKYNGQRFILECYRKILDRLPTKSELDSNLSYLKKVHKIDVVYRIKYTQEGQAKRIKIKHLKSARFLSHHLPKQLLFYPQ